VSGRHCARACDALAVTDAGAAIQRHSRAVPIHASSASSSASQRASATAASDAWRAVPLAYRRNGPPPVTASNHAPVRPEASLEGAREVAERTMATPVIVVSIIFVA